MKKSIFVIAVAMLLFAAGSVQGSDDSRTVPTDFDYGSWADSTYRNDFFGFSIMVPEGWYFSGTEKIDALREKASDAGFIDQKEVKRLNKVIDITGASLVMTSPYPPEEALKKKILNPNLVLMAENISLSEQEIDLAAYVEISRQNLSKAIPGIIIKSETVKTVGGREFTSLETQFSAANLTISQESLVCLMNGFALVITMTSFDEASKKQLDDIVATLAWD